MPSKIYTKGRKKEYKIVHRERDKGCIAFRSAGSHSPIDVVSIDAINKKIRFIQSKSDFMNENKKQKIREKNKELNGLFEVSFSVL